MPGKRKYSEISDCKYETWICASQTKSYLIGDPCIDWITMHNNKNSPTKRRRKTTNILFTAGNIFENKIFAELRDIYSSDGRFKMIFTEDDYDCYCSDKYKNGCDNVNGVLRKKYNETIKSMREGIPLIGQAVMINDENKTFGIADLLIRTDYLAILFPNVYLDDEICIIAPGLKIKTKVYYHYRVIDYKWTTLNLHATEKTTIANSGLVIAYKGQIAIYNKCLKQMQGYVPNYAYIMSRAYKIKKNIVANSCFDRLGVVDFNVKDNFIYENVSKAINWLSRLNKNGATWTLGKKKPSVIEMYPNMNNDKLCSHEVHEIKKSIAEKYGEITQGWYITTKNRQHAHSKGITNIRDPRCNLSTLHINPHTKRAKIIDAILQINYATQTRDIIRPSIVLNNENQWKKKTKFDYYIDFETMNSVIYDDPTKMDIDNSNDSSSTIFMIGIGFDLHKQYAAQTIMNNIKFDKQLIAVNITVDSLNKWEFVTISANKCDDDNQCEMIKIMFEFIYLRNNILSNCKYPTSKFFHWTDAEKRFIMSIKNKNKNHYVANIINELISNAIWIDMCRVFKNEPIVIKDAFRFKLKCIANAMYRHGLIKTHWENDSICDGLTAMLEALKIYKSCQDSSLQSSLRDGCSNVTNNCVYKKIMKYNEIDCKVIWEIVSYLRKNH